MLDCNLEQLLANYEDTISRIEARLKDNLAQREQVIKQQKIIGDEILNGIENLIGYLKLVAVNADNLIDIRDDLKSKTDSKRIAYERSKENEANLKARMAAANNLVAKLKEDIRNLKLDNEKIHQQIKSDDSTNPLALKLFKSIHR